jgi:hypothetical protein
MYAIYEFPEIVQYYFFYDGLHTFYLLYKLLNYSIHTQILDYTLF